MGLITADADLRTCDHDYQTAALLSAPSHSRRSAVLTGVYSGGDPPVRCAMGNP
jgi:hypothetical protein